MFTFTPRLAMELRVTSALQAAFLAGQDEGKGFWVGVHRAATSTANTKLTQAHGMLTTTKNLVSKFYEEALKHCFFGIFYKLTFLTGGGKTILAHKSKTTTPSTSSSSAGPSGATKDCDPKEYG